MYRSAQKNLSPSCNITEDFREFWLFPLAATAESRQLACCSLDWFVHVTELPGSNTPRADPMLGKAGKIPLKDWVSGPFSQSPLTVWQNPSKVSGTFLRNNCNVQIDAVLARVRMKQSLGLAVGVLGTSPQWAKLHSLEHFGGRVREESEVWTSSFFHFYAVFEVNLCLGKGFMFYARQISPVAWCDWSQSLGGKPFPAGNFLCFSGNFLFQSFFITDLFPSLCPLFLHPLGFT